MFCYQCQETAKGQGCTIKGVCGKTPEVAGLQDLLIYTVKGISILAVNLRDKGVEIPLVNKFIIDSLFMTITNANFDTDRFVSKIKESYDLRNRLINELKSVGGDIPSDCDMIIWREDLYEDMCVKAKSIGILSTEDEDIRSLKELTIYGVKGMAAYVEHAYNLGFEDPLINIFIQKALVETTMTNTSADKLTALVLECGAYGVKAMSLLDKANTTKYGNPEITKVKLGVGSKPAILISGHDLRDLEELLEQTKDSGVDIYTHGEMLPAHSYPAFKKYNHLIGNYGGAWWKQVSEFESFNGVVLFTTNCIVPPPSKSNYSNRVYTTGTSGFTGFTHIEDRVNNQPKDFSKLIEHAKSCSAPTEIESGEIIGGFAHAQVIALADKVVNAVKAGLIKNFVVMAGCDGRMKNREYYTEFAQKLSHDSVILTAGCAKYRYNKLALGDIAGIPRVLDAGQCNDSYSLVVIALKLKEAFNLDDINDLPIQYNIAWYEQKAVIVLLALLSLGVKNIKLGPTLPAFLSPNVAAILINNFGITGIGTVDEDLIKMGV